MLKQTQQLCRIHNIKPSRSKGQNFLINPDIYQQLVKLAAVDKSDVILEVGPGLGFLTVELADKAKQVIAVELDDKLAKILKSQLSIQKYNNIRIVNADILDWPYLDNMPKDKYKIVANLPYNITSIFLRKFLESEHKPESMVLMLQKEVAERIVAKPGKM
ncbi:MAG: rRNA adenine dimethyltransferase family protein, partial [bacterium]